MAELCGGQTQDDVAGKCDRQNSHYHPVVARAEKRFALHRLGAFLAAFQPQQVHQHQRGERNHDRQIVESVQEIGSGKTDQQSADRATH